MLATLVKAYSFHVTHVNILRVFSSNDSQLGVMQLLMQQHHYGSHPHPLLVLLIGRSFDRLSRKGVWEEPRDVKLVLSAVT